MRVNKSVFLVVSFSRSVTYIPVLEGLMVKSNSNMLGVSLTVDDISYPIIITKLDLKIKILESWGYSKRTSTAEGENV